MQAEAETLREIINVVLASFVVKIEPVTLAQLAAALPLKVEEIGKAGGLATTIDFDPANILTLVRGNQRFRDWIQQIATDVGYFQDQEFGEQVKNFVAPVQENVAGRTTNSVQ